MTEKTTPKAADAVKPTLREQMEAVRPRPRIDKQIWGIYFALIFISLIELYSASSREIVSGSIMMPVFRQGILLFVGFLIMVGLQRVHYRRFYQLTYPIVILCILATLYTMKFGLIINGARRAFSFFGLFTVQPSELLKFAIALVIARLLCNYIVHLRPGHEQEDRQHNHRLVTWVALLVLGCGALLIPQGLTNTILLFAIAMSLMLIGGVRWKEWGCVLLVFGVLGLGYIGYKSISGDGESAPAQTEARSVDRTGTRVNRIKQFLRTDKYNDSITSQNSQEMYSYIAQANGGVIGRFPGNSRETARLPLAFSDYIFAIIIEDMGLIGGTAVMLLYLWLLARAGRIAMKCRKAFPALLVIGMAVFIVCQALMHMGIVTGFLPVSGQPLPLISKGGSSVIVTSVALGMMLSVSRFALRKGQKQEANSRVAELSDSDMPDNPSQL